VSANYTRIYHIIKSKNPLVKYVGPVEKYLICECFYNGKKIVKNNPGLGYILGDEGSGSYLGKKVIQYFLYNTFDADLYDRFQQKYHLDKNEILDRVYKGSLPNRFIASFTDFLVENRGHFMVENIIEDGLNDFFINHIYKYKESWSLPVHFVGSVAFGFKDVIKQIMESSELKLGKITKSPMIGLIAYHKK
jgi:N-acetylglucosamine kinase-like BadF-type ATPase